jgi:tRNA (guanine26-N2/guanine27-N2)-dimethyltransferase
MWSGPIHNNGFISKVLEHLESNQGKYSTAVRMKGMLTVAKEVRLKTVIVLKLKLISGILQELHVPFYFTPSRIAGFFHSVCPPLDDVAYVIASMI